MNENRLYLDIHAIQTLPPSNANRDDTGSPKTAVYGGVRRARVSSQAWKHAMRKMFVEDSSLSNKGVRTKYGIHQLADEIKKRDASLDEDAALKKAMIVFCKLGIIGGLKNNKQKNDEKKVEKAISKFVEDAEKIAKKNDKEVEYKTDVVLFFSRLQIDKLAELAIDGETECTEFQRVFNENPAIDIALFGRMVASNPELGCDASAQVVHAISTHGVQTEFDFYTAVDDLAPEDNAGAAMLDTIEYNSSTLYRYANIAMHDLVRQLGDKRQAINAAELFIESFSNSMPTGKINSFANQTLPQLLMVNIRQDRPVNLVSAFENPVKAKNGNAEPSIIRLFEEEKKVERFVKKPLKSIVVLNKEINVPDWADEENDLGSLIESLCETVEKLL